MEQQRNNTGLLAAMVFGIGVTICAMVLAIYLAGQRPIVVVLNSAQTGGQAGTAPAAAAVDGGKPAVDGPFVGVTASRRDSLPPASNPLDAAWDKVPAMDVQMLPQTMAMPTLTTPTIMALKAQAARDGGKLSLKLSWACAKPSYNVDTNLFGDAVAVQFPLSENTPFTMGGPGKPVRILHWKALWQKDLDDGFQDVQNLHPNFWADMYWFSEGKFPFPITEAFKNPVARQWLVALQSGNPMADHNRRQPIEEVVAAGFGTATHLSYNTVSAKGVWKDGRWNVVIERPLTPGDALSDALTGGKANMISFAVWDGSALNVGGRKHYCNWIPFRLEP